MNAIGRLLTAGGLSIGVGDWRPEKGKGTFGQFEIVDPTDERFLDVIETGGRDAQIAAMKDPRPNDDETTELLEWYLEERQRRQLRGVA